jgi:DNA-directed RNA polymerase II subunit RPB2
MGMDIPTNRDNFKYKRVEIIGRFCRICLGNIPSEQGNLSGVRETLYFNEKLYGSNLFGLIDNNYKEVFKQRSLDDGFRKAFKGNWGRIPFKDWYNTGLEPSFV